MTGDDADDDVFDDSEDDDDEDDDIDPETMAGLEALAAQLMQEGGLEELDVTVDGEPRRQQARPAMGQGSTNTSANRGGGAAPAGARGQASNGGAGALNGSSSSSSNNSSMRAMGRSQPRDPFQVGLSRCSIWVLVCSCFMPPKGRGPQATCRCLSVCAPKSKPTHFLA
eukprot:scaffold50103_cov19-Tisochrysis_lutea.AAC.1